MLLAVFTFCCFSSKKEYERKQTSKQRFGRSYPFSSFYAPYHVGIWKKDFFKGMKD